MEVNFGLEMLSRLSDFDICPCDDSCFCLLLRSYRAMCLIMCLAYFELVFLSFDDAYCENLDHVYLVLGAKIPLYAVKKLDKITGSKGLCCEYGNRVPPVAFLDSLLLGEVSLLTNFGYKSSFYLSISVKDMLLL